MALSESQHMTATDRTFEEFERVDGARLKRALMARFGLDSGSDAAAAALEYAWTNWERLRSLDNLTGYLWRVGCTAARRDRRAMRFAPSHGHDAPMEQFDPALLTLLRRLQIDERTSVVLVHGYGWTYAEVADTLGVSVASVTNHVHRGMKRPHCTWVTSTT